MVRIIILILGFFITLRAQNSDWYSVNMTTGSVPSCFVSKGLFDKTIDNYLNLYVGAKSDIVVKIVRFTDNQCIRCVYIKGGDSYFITNIPQGIYYLKIAYGNNWAKFDSKMFCLEKFLDPILFQKGEDLLDYFVKSDYSGYQIPSYELRLEVYENMGNTFQSETISEEEFMK